MDLSLNRALPLIMHVDLNSCFATIEQQANPLLRGKALVVAAYSTPNGCVLAPSIEAKRFGIKTGMPVRDARLLCPTVVVRTPDPVKYRDVHVKFRKIFCDYSPDVVPKSIDEAIIDFTSVAHLHRDLVSVGREIKQRMREEIGEWIICSIGIASNRFLAKLAASLHKPDGLDVITYTNLKDVYGVVSLMDLCGINVAYEARLNSNGIFTPLDFLSASSEFLHKQVFKSIVGVQWYQRLRGYEVDDVVFARKSIGQDYALKIPTANTTELSKLLMKLCEKMGRRLRRAGLSATGVHVGCVYRDWSYWHKGKKTNRQLYTTAELYRHAQSLLHMRTENKPIAKLSVSCYGLSPIATSQIGLFEDEPSKLRHVSDAMDKINDRYGEFVITPALMMDMEQTILDRIAFGSVSEVEDFYG